ncbi:MAG: exosortase H [Acidobacteria bacterium]|nr:exosortase H [Acidobacteriota bacterium]
MASKRRGFVIRFAGLLLLGFLLIVPPVVQIRVLQPFTESLAAASAVLLHAVGHEVTHTGTTLFSRTFAVDVRNGCNGVEAALILIAAILATPARWSAKLVGVIGGVVVLQAINLVRISSLYLLGYYNRALFDLFHSALWQVLIILIAVGIFVYWSVKIAPRRDTPAAA